MWWCRRPGDVIVGDVVVVVPSTMCERVLEIAAEREKIERVIKKNFVRT